MVRCWASGLRLLWREQRSEALPLLVSQISPAHTEQAYHPRRGFANTPLGACLQSLFPPCECREEASPQNVRRGFAATS